MSESISNVLFVPWDKQLPHTWGRGIINSHTDGGEGDKHFYSRAGDGDKHFM